MHPEIEIELLKQIKNGCLDLFFGAPYDMMAYQASGRTFAVWPLVETPCCAFFTQSYYTHKRKDESTAVEIGSFSMRELLAKAGVSCPIDA